MEFTNSFTMKVMNEPYRSSVENIRTRARNYRNSLSNVIKWSCFCVDVLKYDISLEKKIVLFAME